MNHSYLDVIREIAESDPARVALRWDGGELGFGALLAKAEELAGELAVRGVGAGRTVALRLPRGPALVVAMLGVTRAGAAFLPLAPEEPEERLRMILGDSDASLVLCQTGGPRAPEETEPVMLLPDGRLAEPSSGVPPTSAGPRREDLAYVVYTSGSTGRPKGVMVEHGALLDYLTWCATTLLDAGAPMPAISSPAFDASLKQTLGTLVAGAQVWLIDDATATDPLALAGLLARPAPYAFNCVPSLWRAVLAELEAVPGEIGLRRLLLGGEAADAELVARTRSRAPGVEIWNLYGPTETTANASAGVVTGSGTPTLGRPLPGRRLYVLAADGSEVMPGESGELFIGGDGVARGYRGRPAQTAERFVPDPFSPVPGARMFRTGDLVRRRADGDLEYLGRRDRMVKRSGVRIELDEIEHAIRRIAGVRDAAVFMRETAMVAAVEAPHTLNVRRELTAWLPRAALPDVIRIVDALPRTAGGKTDLDALRAAQDAATGAAERRTTEEGSLEDLLAAIWARVLELPEVSPEDDFFEVGGHSLAMLRIVGRVGELFDVDLPVDLFFDAPTVALQAQAIREKLGVEADARAVREPAAGRRP
ncbi:non-ribosomal peptide synthetase [Microbispora sp. KK1-11]|uniref:non-ribosomal peptide synthetase n=1 Tax=Microbispora sp. KK1-11 TaxID=2053005 RepID=UPI001158F4C8|nr:non-ribosomal peptide synthetase [Microbispora sp. KK1-11]TQS25868.1 non-ribosomal peptide synthetase [Microbispora sp. KK1-11]